MMMTGRIYVLKYKGDPKMKYEQFRKMARTIDMDFEGDVEKGHFNGGPYVAGFHIGFKGSYEVKEARSRSPYSRSQPWSPGSWWRAP